MHDIFEFVLRHWALSLLLVVLFLLIVWNEFRTQIGGVKKIFPQQVLDLLNHQNGLVLDIRDGNAFGEGHILSAMHLPVSDFADNQIPKKLQKYKNLPVIVVCGNGQQSLKIGAQLHKNGFSQIYALQGGLTAWRSAQLPVTKK